MAEPGRVDPTPPRPAWQETNVDAAPVRLHVHRLVAEGAPLMLLHGLGVSGGVWRTFARHLLPAWAAIAPDLRGHGESGQPPAGPAGLAGPVGGYAPADYAADVIRLLDALGVDRLPLAGHSLGALVALAVAGTAPERVTALVLIDPPLDPARQNPDVEPVCRLRHAPPGALEAYLERSNAPAIARTLAVLFRRADDRAFEAHLKAPPGAPWAWEVAGRITTPALLVQADPAGDGVLGDAAAADFARRLVHGRHLSIPGAHHAIHASHPGELAGAILSFLRPFVPPGLKPGA